MFLRFDEVRSSGEKQHDVVVVFVPPALVVASCLCCDCERSGGSRGAGRAKRR